MFRATAARRLRPALLAALAALAALASPAGAAATPRDDYAVSRGWLRAAPPGAAASAAFFTLDNRSGADRTLVGVRTPVAGRVEMHTHSMAGGMMQMREVESIAVPAGSPAVLRPGGKHLMVFDVKRPLRAGETIDFELQFDDGSVLVIGLPVRTPADRGY